MKTKIKLITCLIVISVMLALALPAGVFAYDADTVTIDVYLIGGGLLSNGSRDYGLRESVDRKQ